MSQGTLIGWKEESDAIHREMDRLLAVGWPETAEERQVRKIQFMALIERRNVAARNFLKSGVETARVSNNHQKPSETPEVPPDADPMPEVKIVNVKVSQEQSEAALAIDRSPQTPPASLMPEVEIVSVKVSQEPSEAALAIDRSPQAPPANPIFEVRNFLKSLGLK